MLLGSSEHWYFHIFGREFLLRLESWWSCPKAAIQCKIILPQISLTHLFMNVSADKPFVSPKWIARVVALQVNRQTYTLISLSCFRVIAPE